MHHSKLIVLLIAEINYYRSLENFLTGVVPPLLGIQTLALVWYVICCEENIVDSV